MSSATLKGVVTGAIAQEKARSPYEGLKHQLETSKGEFKALLGTDANVDKFIRVVLNACLATPDLLEADRRSLIAASMKAAQDGLMPDGREAVLNIYNSKVSKKGQPDEWRKMAQYLPMVGGMIKKLYESGEVIYVDAAAVYAKDKFTFRRGDDPKLEHEPTLEDDPGIIVAAYVVIKLKTGEIKREVMPRRDIEAVRNASKSKDKGPWVDWYDQQSIKSVIKRAYKQLPKVDALERIIAADNEAMGFTTASSIGDIVKPSEAPLALENSPSETIDFGHPAVDAALSEFQQEAATLRESASGPSPYLQIEKDIKECKSIESLDLIADEVRGVLDEFAKNGLNALIKQRRAKLEQK